ncbi:Rossmann-like and DUF2520 domain-containing protein [Hymenobacter jejuensis]|uniref:DUF2520 domain-containing protein n=1 Tax=Hymenobacter jejuensis TaxID=2502781 RepID=A0A5B8A0H0_9BACT|nr:Rossmann-like and DUF2520 domain-containing protein [Hymenobacter jejuensis]QDA59622.1 DUF2520 domain-containing protein [Hymenobacter jejuensis]
MLPLPALPTAAVSSPNALRVVLLGAGRVAAHLAPALEQAGHRVVHIWSRSAASATSLAARLHGATADTDPDLRHLEADVFVLAVPDAAVANVLQVAHFPMNALVTHTAGALPLDVFAAYSGVRGGVFYPLQTFSPGRAVAWETVPLCIEAAEAVGEATLLRLAHSLSHDVRLVATPARLALHVAAVFASNFTNHVLGISHALMQEAGLPFDLLAPLVRETTEKALANPPFTVQTGPAARQDTPTLHRHEAALAAHPQWQALYKALTISIQQQAQAPARNNEDPK